MIPPTLRWFATQLCGGYKAAPLAIREFGKQLEKQFDSPHPALQVNRIFKRSAAVQAKVLTWLESQDVRDAIQRTNNQETQSAYISTIESLKKIRQGETPSKAWGIGRRRGPDTSFSTTLEADAIVRYLSTVQDDSNERLYSENKARAIAGELLNVHPDTIRHFKGPEPCDDKSVAVIAFWALVSAGKLKEADKYFDVDDLRDAMNRSIEPSVEN